jgi:hypothetical protein
VFVRTLTLSSSQAHGRARHEASGEADPHDLAPGHCKTVRTLVQPGRQGQRSGCRGHREMRGPRRYSRVTTRSCRSVRGRRDFGASLDRDVPCRWRRGRRGWYSRCRHSLRGTMVRAMPSGEDVLARVKRWMCPAPPPPARLTTDLPAHRHLPATHESTPTPVRCAAGITAAAAPTTVVRDALSIPTVYRSRWRGDPRRLGPSRPGVGCGCRIDTSEPDERRRIRMPHGECRAG